jgi:hypothetical protein
MRGFKALPPAEEGEPEPEDEELDAEAEDFDREAYEKLVMKNIMDSKKGLIIDGNWTTMPEDAVQTPMQDLLVESRRMPEMVITFKCKPETTFKRCLDEKAVKEAWENINKGI